MQYCGGIPSVHWRVFSTVEDDHSHEKLNQHCSNVWYLDLYSSIADLWYLKLYSNPRSTRIAKRSIVIQEWIEIN